MGFINNIFLSLIFTLPHGVFEFLGFFMTSYFVNKSREVIVPKRNYIESYVIIFIAAIIEVLVTPVIVNFYLSRG